jgi:hypothetical protein
MHFVSSEALLEMYYLQPTLQELQSVYGASSLRLIKPSQADEAWIGFDQAWVASKQTDDEFIEDLRKTLSEPDACSTHYFALLRQYKRVEKIGKASIHTPYRSEKNEWSCPYYRVDLSTEPGKIREGRRSTGARPIKPEYSQHESLVRLSALKETDVQYVCPMVFDSIDIWQFGTLKNVRMVPIGPQTPAFTDADRHFLCFRNTTDKTPEFHSERGYETISIDMDAWKERLLTRRKEMQLDAFGILKLILTISKVISLGSIQDIALIERQSSETATELLSTGQSRTRAGKDRSLWEHAPEFLTILRLEE